MRYWEYDRDPYDLPRAAQHLIGNKATLETLHLDLRGQSCPATGFFADLIPDLPQFSVLRHLFLNTLPLYLSGSADDGPASHHGI